MERVSREDYELLKRLAAREGDDATLVDVAADLERDYPKLRYWLTAMGLRYAPLFTIRASLGGRRLSDLLAAGEIVPDDAPAAEPAGATA
jgi:hypothetical protein